MRELSWEAAAAWNGPPVEFLFVDADHSYTAIRRDFESWEAYVALDGVIAFHDTNPCDRIAPDSPPAAATRDILESDAGG